MSALPLIGNIVEGVLGIGEKLIDKTVKDKDLAEKLKHEFRMVVQSDNHELEMLEAEAETRMFESQQKTIQAELHQDDRYTKQTRPKIARQSWYVTAAYSIASTFLPAMPAAWGLQSPAFQWEIFLVLASPALTYMGVRGFEKWKAGGSK